jgi:hypothetical protein
MKTRLSAEAAETATSRKALATSAEESRMDRHRQGEGLPSELSPKS